MAEVTALSAEGSELLVHLGPTVHELMGPDLQRYVVIRKRLSELIDAAKHSGFPIPPGALEARKARKELDASLAQLLEPLKKMLG